MVRNFMYLHPVRDASLGRKNEITRIIAASRRDASLTGCQCSLSPALSTERCNPNGLPFDSYKMYISRASDNNGVASIWKNILKIAAMCNLSPIKTYIYL